MASIPNQIVVATEHRQLVDEELQVAALPIAERTENPRLGLTLVELPPDADLRRAAHVLWRAVPEDERTCLHEPYEVVDLLLASLRDRFRRRYSGWTPTMGKNRLVHGIELLPYASVVGFELPEQADRPDDVSPGRPQVQKTDPARRRVRVGIIDVRLAPHPRLEGGYLADPDGLDLPHDGLVRQGWQGHATFIANLILQHAPSAELVVRSALEETPNAADPEQRFHMPLWRLAERLLEFEDAGVEVLNCSLGCETRDAQPPLVLDRAIARLSSKMVIVAAAGNHGSPDLTEAQRGHVLVPTDPSAALFPAALDGVLAVGARNEKGAIAPFNPRGGSAGGWAPWIDGFCRGTGIVSAYLGDGDGGEYVELPVPGTSDVQHRRFSGWARWSGTSFAAAHATGTIAALIAGGETAQEALAAVRSDPAFRRRESASAAVSDDSRPSRAAAAVPCGISDG